MILVDTSVLIDFLKGIATRETEQLENIIKHDIPFGIHPLVYQEILQGSKNDKEFAALRHYLGSLNFYDILHEKASYENAARMYYQCRRKGISIRSSIDLLIAQTAIENDLYLLHSDSDFSRIASIVPELKIYRSDAK